MRFPVLPLSLYWQPGAYLWLSRVEIVPQSFQAPFLGQMSRNPYPSIRMAEEHAPMLFPFLWPGRAVKVEVRRLRDDERLPVGHYLGLAAARGHIEGEYYFGSQGPVHLTPVCGAQSDVWRALVPDARRHAAPDGSVRVRFRIATEVKARIPVTVTPRDWRHEIRQPHDSARRRAELRNQRWRDI